MSASDDDSLVTPLTDVETATNTELLDLRGTVEVSALETIPVPRTRVQNTQSFEVVTDDVTAWPDQRLVWRFEYNDYSHHWIFECEHPTMGRLFHGRQRAVLGRTYSEYPYFMARFHPTAAADTVGAPTRVTPQNLGERVYLTVAPGPAGGSFVPEAGVTEREEDALLGRFASTYPVTKEWVE